MVELLLKYHIMVKKVDKQFRKAKMPKLSSSHMAEYSTLKKHMSCYSKAMMCNPYAKEGNSISSRSGNIRLVSTF